MAHKLLKGRGPWNWKPNMGKVVGPIHYKGYVLQQCRAGLRECEYWKIHLPHSHLVMDHRLTLDAAKRKVDNLIRNSKQC